MLPPWTSSPRSSAAPPNGCSGSVALNVYAEPRMTRDIDFVVDMRREHVEGFVRAFEEDCYVDPEMVRVAVDQRDMFTSSTRSGS